MTTPQERVYFLQAEQGGAVKIGRTNDVERRVADIQRMSPVPLQVLAIAEGGAALETRLHQKFYDDKKHGEWFSPSEGLMAMIEYYRGNSESEQHSNRVIQMNLRAPESSRDVIHEIMRRLRHERGFEDFLRNVLSGDVKGDQGETEARLEALEGQVEQIKAKVFSP